MKNLHLLFLIAVPAAVAGLKYHHGRNATVDFRLPGAVVRLPVPSEPGADAQAAKVRARAPVTDFKAFEAAFHERFGLEWAPFSKRARAMELEAPSSELIAKLQEFERADGVAELLGLRSIEPNGPSPQETREQLRALVQGSVQMVDALRTLRAEMAAFEGGALPRVKGLREIAVAVEKHASSVAVSAEATFYDRILGELDVLLPGLVGLPAIDLPKIEEANSSAHAALELITAPSLALAKQPGGVEALLVAEFGVPEPVAAVIAKFVREVVVPFIEQEILPELARWIDEFAQEVEDLLEDLWRKLLELFEDLLRSGRVDREHGEGAPLSRDIQGLIFDASVSAEAVMQNVGASELGPYRVLPYREDGRVVFAYEHESGGERSELVVDEAREPAFVGRLCDTDRVVTVRQLSVEEGQTTLALQGLGVTDQDNVVLVFEAGQLAKVTGLVATAE